MILIGALKLNLIRLPVISSHLRPLSRKRSLCLISPKPSASTSIVITSSTTFVIPDTFTLRAVLEGASGGSGGDSGTGSDGGYTYISLSAVTLVTANPGTGGQSAIDGGAAGTNGDGSWSAVYDKEMPTFVTGGSSSAPGMDNSGGSGGVGGKVIIPNLIKGTVHPRSVLTITIGTGGAGGAGGQSGGDGKITLSWT